MSEELSQIEQQAQAELAKKADFESLAQWKNSYLGKSGSVTRFSRGLGALPPEERPQAGQRINALREVLETAYADAEARIKSTSRATNLEAERIDVSLPGRQPEVGGLHLTTQVLRQTFEIFATLGFQIWESREVETDDYNFGLLNFAPDHPARDMQDTFYVEMPPNAPKVVLRTHTSPGQIHAMRRYAPQPLRVLLPGKCYRSEQVTSRSEFMFHQFEFLAVGQTITMSDLKGTLHTFAEQMFGKGTEVRLRPSFFPFTEPSAELDVSCFLCKGKGCRVCKSSGWLEIGGCGMVHPNVLANGGYDPMKFSGFAGGFGPERIAMLKYDIDDIRLFHSGDLRFLRQFG